MTSPIFLYKTKVTRAIPVIEEVMKRAVFKPSQENCSHGSTCPTVLYLHRGKGILFYTCSVVWIARKMEGGEREGKRYQSLYRLGGGR